jgi:hypothetical protein
MLVLLSGSDSLVMGLDGKLWQRRAGAWAPAKDPFFDVILAPAGSNFDQARAFPSVDGSDQYLVVQSRSRKLREFTHDELVAAAERFFPPLEASDLKLIITQPSKPDDPGRTWGPLGTFDREVSSRLYWSLRHPDAINGIRYRNVDAYRALLAELDLHAKTVLTLVRAGRPVARVEVAGYNDSDSPHLPVAWRAQGDGFVAVLSLRTADTTEPSKEEARFHVIHAQPPAPASHAGASRNGSP